MARKASEPKRLYYKIGEACKLLDIQPYVLRYWETEFPQLAPNKSRSGQRVYSEDELQIIRRIKELLYLEGFTIAGAKKRLDQELAGGNTPTAPAEAPAELAAVSTTASQAVAKVPAGRATASFPAPPTDLDTHGEEQIETLRAGVGQALRQAREILNLLRSRPSQDP